MDPRMRGSLDGLGSPDFHNGNHRSGCGSPHVAVQSGGRRRWFGEDLAEVNAVAEAGRGGGHEASVGIEVPSQAATTKGGQATSSR
jgi:hypothetical protein